ncbi:MAG: GAF domain-containing protein [Deltaproteobacteria bacterium]|nr:GAF domain-containing protein [Deltaproteobacteria bacterium]
MPDPRANSLLLGSVFAVAIFVSVVLRRGKTRRVNLFVLFCGSVAVWYVLDLLKAWRADSHWRILSDVALVVLPQMAMRFFTAFLGDEPRGSRLVPIGTALGVVVLAGVVSPLGDTTFLQGTLFAYAGGLLYTTVLFLYRRSRRVASRVESARIQFLVVGGALALTFSLLDYLPVVGVEFPPLGPIFTLIYLYTLSQALLLYRLLDVYELVGRFAVLSALALTLAAIFYALVQWLGTSTWFFLNAMAAAFVILIVFDPLRTMVEQKIGEIITRERSQFESQVLMLRRRLPRLLNLEDIAGAVVGALEESQRFTHGSLYLLSADGLSLLRRGCFGPLPAPELEVAAARPLLDRIPGDEPVRRVVLQREREALLQTEEKDVRKVETLDGVLGILADLQADAVFPVRGESRMLGLLALRDERMPEGFAQEDLALLSGLAVQIAIAAENIELYRQMKVRDRLAVVGEMSAGLAHEIRNPLGSIKAAAQILAEDSPPDDKGMLEVLVEESNRLNRVVTEFLEYARPQGGAAGLAAVGTVLRRCLQLLQAEHGDAVRCELSVGEGLPDVPVDPERLLQVFLNLALNAAQAMGGSGTLDIVAAVRRDSGPTAAARAGGHRRVAVRFRDHGPGIPPEVLPRIFIPFFTTKDRGTGLGLAISQRIVEDAGGTIEVRSEVGQGADFTVVLPAGGPADERPLTTPPT